MRAGQPRAGMRAGAAGESARATTGAPMLQGRGNIIGTLIVGAAAVWVGFRFVNWAVIHAVWSLPAGAGSSACRAVMGKGACWAVVGERARFILFGAYPAGEQWRPALATGLFLALYAASANRRWWRSWLAMLWAAVPLCAIALLAKAPTDVWGGLPLTFLLSTVGFGAAMPFGVLLALGRRSRMPAVRMLSTGYIELIRGVPMVTFLFMAAVMFPLFLPQTFTLDKLLRAQLAFTMVIAAYLAEVIRGGLQAIPKGQLEAAAAIGLPFWRATMLVVLPQALRAAIPGLVNTLLAFFKDTSLVAVIGLFDLLGSAKAVLADQKWVGFGVEVYLFAAAIYFAFCYAASRYSLRLELALAAETHR